MADQWKDALDSAINAFILLPTRSKYKLKLSKYSKPINTISKLKPLMLLRKRKCWFQPEYQSMILKKIEKDIFAMSPSEFWVSDTDFKNIWWALTITSQNGRISIDGSYLNRLDCQVEKNAERPDILFHWQWIRIFELGRINMLMIRKD